MYFSVDLPSNGSWVTRYKQQSSKPGPYSWCNERTTRSCTLSWTWWVLCKCKLTFPRLVCFIPSLSFLPYLFEELGIAKSSAYVNTWFHLSVHSPSSLVYELICISILFIIFYHSTFVGSAWSFVFSSPPQRPMTANFEGFSIPDLSYLNSWERASISLLIMSAKLLVPFFITSLVWRGPWLEIEPGTSRTRCQHSIVLEVLNHN